MCSYFYGIYLRWKAKKSKNECGIQLKITVTWQTKPNNQITEKRRVKKKKKKKKRKTKSKTSVSDIGVIWYRVWNNCD